MSDNNTLTYCDYNASFNSNWYVFHDLFIYIGLLILFMILLKMIMIRFRKENDSLCHNNKKYTNENDLSSIKVDIVDYDNSKRAIINNLYNNIVSKNELIQSNLSTDMKFTCTFDIKDKAPVLVNANNNTLVLFNVYDLNELKDNYSLIHIANTNKLRSHNKTSPLSTIIDINRIDTNNIEINPSDIFIFDELDYNKIFINNESVYNHIAELVIPMNNSANINVIYNAKVAKNNISTTVIIEFNIHKIKYDAFSYKRDYLYDNKCKKIVNDVVVNLSYPFIILNNNGVLFLNRCCCDWLNLSYDLIDRMEPWDRDSSIKQIFDIIDVELSKHIIGIFNNYYNDSDSIDEQFVSNDCSFYREYLFNIKDRYSNENDYNKIRFKESPRELIVMGSCYYTNSKDLQLMITMHDAITLRKFISNSAVINKSDCSKDFDVIHSINKNDTDLSLYISKMNDMLDGYKNYASRNNRVYIARIKVNGVMEILLSNTAFDNFFKDNPKTQEFLESLIITAKDNVGSFNAIKTYVNNMNIIALYSYYNGILDIIMINSLNIYYMLTDIDLDLISKLYNYSDTAIAIINKKSDILIANEKFNDIFNIKDDMYNTEEPYKRKNLIDFVSDNDKSKVKVSISNPIKYKSFEYNDTIRFKSYGSKNKSIVMNCIKSYCNINGEDAIIVKFINGE